MITMYLFLYASNDGQFLLVANQMSGDVIVFKRNIQTGLLTNTGVEIKVLILLF
jgi:6-phosphogluconolactonase (cycloisomerase 2 family)